MSHTDINLDESLPSQQHRYAGLALLSELTLHRRRESLFLLLSGLFLGTLTMLNILGITRFIQLFEINFDGATLDAQLPLLLLLVCFRIR